MFKMAATSAKGKQTRAKETQSAIPWAEDWVKELIMKIVFLFKVHVAKENAWLRQQKSLMIVNTREVMNL